MQKSRSMLKDNTTSRNTVNRRSPESDFHPSVDSMLLTNFPRWPSTAWRQPSALFPLRCSAVGASGTPFKHNAHRRTQRSNAEDAEDAEDAEESMMEGKTCVCSSNVESCDEVIDHQDANIPIFLSFFLCVLRALCGWRLLMARQRQPRARGQPTSRSRAEAPAECSGRARCLP